MSGFLLGLASGTSCLAFCAPVLVPYLVAEAAGPLRSVPLLARFMFGRLLGYLLFGLFVGVAGSLVGQGPRREIGFGLAFLGLAALLVCYGFGQPRRSKAACVVDGRTSALRRLAGRWPGVLPIVLGLLTGLNLCPPFALAVAGAAESGGVAASVWFFATFFLGTSIFFLPLPGLGALRRFETLRLVARLAAGVVGVYFLYRGVVLVHGGLARL
jgi:sulfite exporter TauE/SafE